MEKVRRKCAAVICVYNNAQTIRDVVEKVLAEKCFLTVVVDDGSTDCCMKEKLFPLPVVLLQHRENQGKGSALDTALKYLVSLPEEERVHFMITLDADGQHEPSDLSAFFALLSGNMQENLLICGCRSFGENVPVKSKLGRYLSNFCIRLETGKKIADTQSGFRAYPVELIRKLECESTRYDWETEILVKALRKGALLREVPVKVHYLPAKERITHFHVWKDNFRILCLHLRLLKECILKKL